MALQRITDRIATLAPWLLGGLLIGRIVITLQLYTAGFLALTADEFTRILWADLWAQRPAPIWSAVWPPLQTYLIGSALLIAPDLILTPRIFTIAVGLMGIVLIYRIGVQLFGHTPSANDAARRAAPAAGLLCALLVVINPAHIWLSATPLSEALFITLALAATWALIRFQQTDQPRWLLAGCLLLTATSGVRFEGWFLGVVASLLLVFQATQELRGQARRAHLQAYGVALLLIWLVPAIWMLGCWVERGDPLYSINYTKSG